MIYGMKPFNSAEMREYLNILEATTTPTVGGASQTANDDGTTTTNIDQGPMSMSSTNRPSGTVNTASMNLGDVTATTATGTGFGGAGKDVQQGGNQISSITNAQGETTSIAGRAPTAQDVEKAINEDFPGTHGDWMHGGFKVRYNPSTKTVTVQGKNQERSHKFGADPTERSYHTAVQQIIDKLEDEAELEESRSDSLVMREWMTICR